MGHPAHNVVDRSISAGLIVGSVLGIAVGGTVTSLRATGYADREEMRIMDATSLFRGASLTKPLIALTALALQEHERLRLDDPVSRYLPYFRPALPNGDVPLITLRHLLTHTSGLGYEYPLDPKITTGMANTDAGLEETLVRIARQPLHFAPGTSWKYSVGSDVLGAVAAAIDGPTVEAAVRKYTTGPLGMNDTSFSVSDPGRLVTPYANSPAGNVRMGEPHVVQDRSGATLLFSPARVLNAHAFQSGGSGIITSVPDFLKLLTCIQSGGSPLLPRDRIRDAISDQLPGMGDCVGPGSSFSYLGKVTTSPQRAKAVWSTGTNTWGGAYGHVWAIDPVKGIAMVSMTNTAPSGGEGQFIRELFQAIFLTTSQEQ